MAKNRMFSAYDRKLGVYYSPFSFLHLGQALRAWETICTDGQSMMSKHPADFVLFEVGEFDDDKGELVAHNPIRQVATALEVVDRQKSKPADLKVPGSAVSFDN